MLKKKWLQFAPLILVALILFACQKESSTKEKNLNVSPNSVGKVTSKSPALPAVTVFATGLNNPRGLKFGPDGYLYVAEGGIGGSSFSSGCMQVPFPIGPYKGSVTGARISRIDYAGNRSTFADNFPSSQSNEITGGDVLGVADVAFIGKTMYALLAGAGCSHGVPSLPNGVVRVRHDGSWSFIANLSDWLMSHPVAHPEPDDFEPDGTPYGMISVDDHLYLIEPNHGDFIKVSQGGNIKRVVDISASQGHIVPTVVAFDKNFYIGNLNTFPIKDGASKILRVTPQGTVTVWATRFTTILGILVDHKDNIYVLENTTGAPGPTPGTGKVIRITKSGARQTIATGLDLPTGMTMGPDGNLYVSNWGFGPVARGGGQILKIVLDKHEVESED